MRLIDADKLNEEMYKAVMEINGYRAQGFEIARNIVNKQDTAYDVEKVVEQIQKKHCKRCRNILSILGAEVYCKDNKCQIDELCDIVRKGGVE